MTEKLCLFCTHFRWTPEEMWGMGSTMTGPMFEGGDPVCMKARAPNKGYSSDPSYWSRPHDEADWREIIVTAQNCPDYDQVKP